MDVMDAVDATLALTPESALKDHDAKVLEKAASFFELGEKNTDMSSRVFVKDALAAVSKELRRMAEERRKP